MQSKAATVAAYLAELPADRRAAVEAVRKVILKNLDKDYEEGMSYGMIGYYVPHRVYPAGYHCDPTKPLPYAGLASQKQYMSVYLMTAYGNGSEERFIRDGFAKAGKKLNMGKCCIRFKKLEDLPLDVIGEAIRRVPAKNYIAFTEKALAAIGKGPAKKSAAKKTASAAAPAKKQSKTKKAASKTKNVARKR